MKAPDDKSAILEQYSQKRQLYDRLVKEIRFGLEEQLKTESLKIAALLGRVKKIESLSEKLDRKSYSSLAEIPDLAGVRIVCLYEPDLDLLAAVISTEFEILDREDKSEGLGADKMGYQGMHFTVKLGPNYSGPRYNPLRDLQCEIQVRTVLQDAWALISHHLAYKNEASIPTRLRRDLNNVTSLLEIAQGVFDSVYEKRGVYLDEITSKSSTEDDFLAQALDHDTVLAYTKWKFPDVGISDFWHSKLLADINKESYRTLGDLDRVVEIARPAVEAYRRENPGTFEHGTDFLTKSLGFVDTDFRTNHSWSPSTLDAFGRHQHLIEG